jgi:transcriptional regulator with XRE-family HTH domain
MGRVERSGAIATELRRMLVAFGLEVERLRTDAGVTRAELARAAGIDASFLREIEAGDAKPSLETCLRIGRGLGADFPLRLYPNTGPALRDHIQAAIAEATLRDAHSRWIRFAEIAVRQPTRGWIDLGLHDPPQAHFVATEIQSELRRFEQLVRWSEEKVAGLPSWEGWPRLMPRPAVSCLLIVRDTRTNREIVDTHRSLVRASFPADGRDALDSLLGTAHWPGAALLWATRRRPNGGYRLVARP